MNQVTIESLKHQLQEKAKEYYRNGKPVQGDKVWSTIDALEDWEKQGFKGNAPVDLAQFGLELPSEDGSGEPEGQPVDDGVVITGSVAPDASEVADEVDRREQLRREAQAAKARGNSVTAADKWRELLTIDPSDAEAQRELQRHAVAAVDQSQRKMLNDLRRKANSELISDLDEALRLARDLLTSTMLNDASQQEVEKLENQAKNKRSVLKAASGEVDTFAAANMLKEAIARLEGFLNQGRFEYEDRDGSIIPTSDKLREYNEEYASFCTQKTAEYIERAETSLPWFPKSALRLLDQAWSSFDRADPSVREKLEQRRIEVGEQITRWETAQSQMGQAAQETDPQQRLALYIVAQSQYDGLFNIKELIEEAKRDAASAVIHDVKNIYAAARLSLSQGDLAGAQKEAMQARERAKQVRGASGELETELANVDQLMSEIAKTAGQQRLAADAATAVNEHLHGHDYQSAEQVLAVLPEDVRALPAVKVLENRIVLARGGNRVYQVAQQRFDKGDFQGVVDLLGVPDLQDGAANRPQGDAKEKFQQLDERSLKLRQRAQAWIHYQDGLTILDRDPMSAELSFELALGLDDTLKTEVEKHRHGVAEKKAQIAQVQQWQENAQGFIKQNDWERAFVELNKARQMDSSLKSEVSQQWLDVRVTWREQLLGRLKTTPADSDAAKTIIDELRANKLLDSEQQAEVDAAEMEYQGARGRREAKAGRWAMAAAAWSAYLNLKPDDSTAQDSLREALREQALADARNNYAQSKDGVATLNLLDERLQQKELQNDPLYLDQLVRQASQYGDFARAQHYQDLLSRVEPDDSALVEIAGRTLNEAQAWSEAKTRSQTAFREGRYSAAVRALDDALEAFPNAATRSQWQEQRNATQRNAVNALLDRAREKKSQAKGLSRVEVISLYSQVIQLVGTGNSQEAEEGITQVQAELPTLVKSIVEEGERFAPETSDPDEALQEAERILGQLNDFRVVTSYMGAERVRWERRIEEVSRKLGNQRDTLNRVTNLLRQVRSELANPINDQKLANAEGWLRDAKREMSRAAGIADLEAQLKTVREERAQVKQVIETLKDAARDVDDPHAFQTVLDAARTLRQIDPEDRYQLLTPQNLGVYDDFQDKHVRTLEEHEQLARERQESYRVYADWEKRSIPQQETFTAASQEVDDKRLRGSLEEQQEALDRTLAIGQRALMTFRDRPKPGPNSFPAEDILTRVEGWQRAAEIRTSDLNKELEQIAQQRTRRDEADGRLKIVLARPVSTINKSEADRFLQELRKLDPNWPELIRREQEVRRFKEAKSGGLFSRLRG